MREKLNRVLGNFPIVVLLVASLALFVSNLDPKSWLSGWDNLHPEFDFALNIKRSFFAVWQEYQGLGLLGGMGHASDLPRQILLWLFSLFVPNQLSRDLYHFVMLFVGTVGVYFLLKDIIFERSKDFTNKTASLVGSIFYLFNLATLQMFFVPFEAYSAHFAFLPWLFWANINFIKNATRKNLIFLLVVNILSLTQAYVPTFFVVYLISLFLIFLFYLKSNLKWIIIALLITFMINAFWLLPNLYFVATSTDVNINAKINQMATEDNLLKNKKFGSLSDTLLLKGFWFDNVEINGEGIAEYQFKDWIAYIGNPQIKIVGYTLFGIALLGMIISFVQRKKTVLVFLPPLALSFIVISNNTSVLSSLADLFFKIPLFSQVFRFPFTKFSLILALCLSIFYAFAYLSLASKLKKKFFQISLGIFFVILPLIFLFPVFQGKLFYNKERALIPTEYFQTFEFFKTQGHNSRIANFPQTTFWGWNFYNFNYSGSGFIWYGIEQSILDRAFDPWSNYNENYYWEISYALYSGNNELFESVLEKYQINWLMVDENIISPASAKSLYTDELEDMLSNSPKTTLAAEFGKIKIYKVNLKTPVNNYVYLLENPTNVEPTYKWNNLDMGYVENGNYISETGNWPRPEVRPEGKLETGKSVYYPFRSLFTGRSQDDLEFQVEDRGDTFVFKNTLPDEIRDYNLSLPDGDLNELPEIDLANLGEISYVKPNIFIDDGAIEVTVPKVGGFLATEINPSTDPRVQKPVNCNKFTPGSVENSVTDDGFLRLTSQNAQNCSVAFWLPDLPQSLSYLISVGNRNISGKSLLFWLENLNIRKADIETYLPKSQSTINNQQLTINNSYFIQPPMASDALGYTLHFDNTSIGQEESINDLGKISVYPIPYKFLTSLQFVSPNESSVLSKTIPVLSVKHPNPSVYEVNQLTINNQQLTILTLSQSFHSGWQAYEVGKNMPSIFAPVFGHNIGQHIPVNNWSNGWTLENLDNKDNQKIVITFLPQYLEYLGLALLVLTFASIGFFSFVKIKS